MSTDDAQPVPIVVAGEALVDLVPRDDGAFTALPGGSPCNVAVGLARAEVPTAFLGALSADGFGVRVRGHLEAAGVDLTLAPVSDAPTMLAVVHLDEDAHASYGFYLDGTAGASLAAGDLPILPAEAPLHVSFGAIGATHPGAGAALVQLVRRESRRRAVCLDPNVRPNVLADDPNGYGAALDELVRWCTLVKASDEDLAALHPTVPPEDTAARWAETGPAWVVVTRGGDGAVAHGAAGRVEVPGRDVEVVDTVGAGDAFTAGLLAALHRRGDLVPGRTDHLDVDTIRAALEHASLVAALTCTREGADPPTLAEVEATRH
ncbi:carbohydrate kinase [Nitriliruptoraceae bacterium ZYF776]|nr:carbohydrate kinase [Profundirhabdus halotolerans]